MKLKRLLCLGISLVLTLSCLSIIPVTAVTEPVVNEVNTAAETIPYLNTNLSFEERAADLVSRMTLEEKVTQLGYSVPAISRLGVHAYNYRGEALHGIARQGKATSFPSSLSMSNTWDRDLYYQAASITGLEARGKNSKYNLSFWSPTINLSRDPRWGRNEESYGEDVYMTAQMGGQFVSGMNGDDPKYTKAISTIKHFVANSCEDERNGGSSVMDEETFRDYYARAFEEITKNVGSPSLMSSYNAITVTRNGQQLVKYEPSTGSKYILTDLLRNKWGFEGFITGDCGAFEEMYTRMQYRKSLFPDAPNIKEITLPQVMAKGFQAGADIDCGNVAQANTYDAVTEGYLDEATLDRSVYRIFLQRFKTGEFDEGAKYQDTKSDVLEKDEHVDIATKAAEESWVLLKNENDILPIKQDVKNIVLVGPLANECFLGDYSGTPEKTVTPYQGLVEQLKTTHPQASVNFIGNISADTTLYNIKSLTLVLNDGKTRNIDLSKATTVKGAKLENGAIKDVKQEMSVTIPSIDFSDVASVKALISTGAGVPGGSLYFRYGEGGPQVAELKSVETESGETYVEVTAEYNQSGGHNRTQDLQLKASANMDFSINTYKSELDNADLVIAYAGTTLSHAAEAHDRKSIDITKSQNNLSGGENQEFLYKVAQAYPQKTIVALSTVGQIDIEQFKDVPGILWTSYNGQSQGTAFGKVLTGQVNPSGKITSTWYDPKDLEIMPIGASSSVVEDGIRYTNNDYGIKPKDGYPGRTYMYYTGTPVYPFGYGLSYTDYEYSNIKIDKTNVTSADKVKVSVDVQNTGNVKGTEVVQLYIQIPGGDGIKLPKMQLKNFARVDLEPQEKKTVDMEVNIKDLHIFDEQNTKTVVPVGEYSVIVGKNCQDQQAQVVKFNVTEEKVELDKVSVLPDGITVKGISANDGTMCIPENEVKANLTAYMSNEVDCDLSKAAVKYTSSNPDVAVVSDDGTVTAAKYEGTATIEGSVTVDGVTKTASFPIVATMKQKVSDAEREEALKQLNDLFTSLPEEAYTSENWIKIQEVYQTGKTGIEEAVDIDILNEVLKKAVSDIHAVETKELKRRYNIKSAGNDVLKNGFVEYGENAIPTYVVTETSITGTITPYNPYTFELEADYYGQKVPKSELTWSIEKLDDSGRESAKIDSSTGEMTITENGLFKVTAKNVKELKCGEALIYVNLQIEGERADVTKGNIADEKEGASGAKTGGNNLGSTKDYWTEFKGVKLDYLNKILIRGAKSSESSTVNVSLAPNDSAENLLASAQMEPTGSWAKWRETELTVNQDVLKWAKKDENGLASVYIQMNGINLDYFRMIYDGVPEEEPIPAGYLIKNTKFGEDGLVVEVENYSDDKVSATLYGAVYDANGALKNEKMCNINDAGEFVLPIAKPEDDTDTVKTFIWNDNMEPMANSKNVGFVEPTAPPTPPPTATPTPVPDLGNEWKVTKADEGKKHGDYVMNNLSVMFPLESVKSTNKVIDDVAFTNYITYSHTEWPIKDESIDTTTLKFEAKEEGYLVVYACDLANYKEFIISRADVTNNKVDEAGKNAYFSNSTGGPTDVALGINVVPGYTYYIYAPGTKARFVGAKFKPLQ